MANVLCFTLILAVCQLVVGPLIGDDEKPESFRDFLLLNPSRIDLPKSGLERLDAAFREEISSSRRKLHEKIKESINKIFETLNQGQRRDLARFLGVEVSDLANGYRDIPPQLFTPSNGEYQIIELLGGHKIVRSGLFQRCSEQRMQIARAEFDKLLKCSTATDFEDQWEAIVSGDMVLNSMAYVAYLSEDQFIKRLDERPFTRGYIDILSRWRRVIVTIDEQNRIVESELNDLKIDWGEANGLSGWYDFKTIWRTGVFNDVTPVYHQLVEEQYDWLSPSQRNTLVKAFMESRNTSAKISDFVLDNNELISFLEENIFPVQHSIIPQHFFLSEGPVFFLSRKEMVERFSIRKSQLESMQNVGVKVSEELMQFEKELCENCVNSVVDALPQVQRQQFCQLIQDEVGQSPAEHFSSLANHKLMNLMRTKWRSPEAIERLKKFNERPAPRYPK